MQHCIKQVNLKMFLIVVIKITRSQVILFYHFVEKLTHILCFDAIIEDGQS